MTKTRSKPLKLNLGCGYDKKPGYINIDALPELEPDLVHDLLKPLPFENQSANLVLAQDILEHFTYQDVDLVIAEISRVLKNRGKLVVRVPNPDQIIDQFDHQPWERNHFLYGNTQETGVFGAHKMGFTPETLLFKMMRLNLFPQELKTIDTNFEATFIKRAPQKQKKLKLAFINQTLGIGGAETFNSDLLAELKKYQNISPTIFTNDQTFAQMLKKKGLPSHKIHTVIDLIGNWKGLLKSLLLFPIAFLEYGFIAWKVRDHDLAMMSGFSEKILFSGWAALFDIPVVWIEFGPLETVFNKFGRLPKLLYRLVKDIPQLVITPTLHTRHQLIPQTRIRLSRFIKIACGRKLPKLQNLALQKKSSQPLIVCISRFEKEKGQNLLLKAFSKILREKPKSKLRFVGSGQNLPNIKNLAKKLGLQKSVEFLGHTPEVFSHIQEATICVFPSVWPLEGFGLVMIEAMALGKPVVAFGRGPALEVIKDGQTGLLAKTQDPQGLAQKCLSLLKNPKLRSKIGHAAQTQFNKKYTISKIGKIYRQTFDNLQTNLKAESWLDQHFQT